MLSKSASHRLHQGVVRALRGSPLPGLSVFLVDKQRPRQPVFENFGVARLSLDPLEKTRPMTEDTILPVGSSLAKNFTALCVTQLHAEGKLLLDEPITKYIPDLRITQAKGLSQPITARHLLSHTSGIREWRHVQDLVDLVRHRIPGMLGGKAVKGPMSLHEYYCGGAKDPPIVAVGTPGGQHLKSHHNYGLLALAAENVTGQDIHTLIKQRVFQPLGMGDTDLSVPQGREDRMASSFIWAGHQGFRPIGKGKRFDASHGRPRAVGGTAYSTAVDMAKYLEALMDPEGGSAAKGGVVSGPILDEMLRPVYQRDAFLPAQGLSFAVEESVAEHDPEVAYVTCGQGMAFAGYQTAFVFSHRRGVGVGVLCNAGSNSYEISQVCAEAFHEATLRAVAAPSAGIPGAGPQQHGHHQHTHNHGKAGQQQQQQQQKSVAAFSTSASAAPAAAAEPSPLRCLQQAQALGRAFGMSAEGFEASVLWPQIVGVYQLPRSQLSARVLWTLGGEVEVYVDDSRLRMRALWGPLRTKLFYTKEKGQVLLPARDGHPLHYSVSGNARQVLATPVNGFTDVAFDLQRNEMSIGLVTLARSPWYMSVRLWLMGLIAYNALKLIGKGKAVDILSSLFIIG